MPEAEDAFMSSPDLSDAAGGAPVIDLRSTVPAPSRARVDDAISAARTWLVARQNAAGFWCAELEGDTTLESYMILLEAFFGRPDSQKARDLARVIRDETLPEGGFAQYRGGPPDLSV